MTERDEADISEAAQQMSLGETKKDKKDKKKELVIVPKYVLGQPTDGFDYSKVPGLTINMTPKKRTKFGDPLAMQAMIDGLIAQFPRVSFEKEFINERKKKRVENAAKMKIMKDRQRKERRALKQTFSYMDELAEPDQNVEALRAEIVMTRGLIDREAVKAENKEKRDHDRWARNEAIAKEMCEQQRAQLMAVSRPPKQVSRLKRRRHVAVDDEAQEATRSEEEAEEEEAEEDA